MSRWFAYCVFLFVWFLFILVSLFVFLFSVCFLVCFCFFSYGPSVACLSVFVLSTVWCLCVFSSLFLFEGFYLSVFLSYSVWSALAVTAFTLRCVCAVVCVCHQIIWPSSDLMFTSILFCFPLSKLTRDFLWLVGVGLGERSELFSGVAMIPSLRGSDAKSTRRRRCTETRPSGDKVGLTLWFCSCVVVYRVCLIVWLSRPSGFRGTNEFRIVVCGLYCRLRFLYYSVSQIPSL